MKRMIAMIISFCVVAYNEEKYLPSLFADICRQTYPREKIEVVLVDSGSEDGTRRLMEAFRDRERGFFGIQVLDNPGRIQAAGWNVAIRNFRGDVLARIDAHTKIPEDFLARNAALLAEGEMVTGGMRPCLIRDPNPWRELLLEAENSLFGGGIAPYRRDVGRRYVKSMFHACYRREVLERVGLMDESLGRTEDNEFHYRIRMAGYRLCFDPEICSYQYARPTLRKMIKQKYENGYWIGVTAWKCPGCLSSYHFVPFLFVCGIAGTGILSLGKRSWPAKLMWAAYGGLCGFMTGASLIRTRKPLTILLPFLFLALHVSYGLGTVKGLAAGAEAKTRRRESASGGIANTSVPECQKGEVTS